MSCYECVLSTNILKDSKWGVPEEAQVWCVKQKSHFSPFITGALKVLVKDAKAGCKYKVTVQDWQEALRRQGERPEIPFDEVLREYVAERNK